MENAEHVGELTSAAPSEAVVGIPASQNPLLLDHILISQAPLASALPLAIGAHGGQVEQEVYERHNIGSFDTTRTRDHRPVSCLLSHAG